MTSRSSTAPRYTALQALEMTVTEGHETNSAPEIVDAAVRAFDDLGYEDASISRIAELAGTSKSLVTYYFPTKKALAGAVIDLAYPAGVFMGVKRTENDPLDAIVWVAEHVTTNVLHNPLARVAIQLVDQETLGTRRSAGKFFGWLARLTDYLEEAQLKRLIPPLLDPAVEARLLLCGIVGLIDVATVTGARLSLIEDAVRLTGDRLQHIRHHPMC